MILSQSLDTAILLCRQSIVEEEKTIRPIVDAKGKEIFLYTLHALSLLVDLRFVEVHAAARKYMRSPLIRRILTRGYSF